MPALIVLQEIFGVNAFIRGVVDRLAGEGFGVIAPDLFWRQEAGVALDPAASDAYPKAMALMNGLDVDLAIVDIATTIAWARKQEWCNGKVGMIGYCLGGKLAFLSASRCSIDAAVSYYGTGIHMLGDDFAPLKAPLLLQIAESDQLCPPEAQAAIKAAAQDNRFVELLSYPGTGHAFARPGAPTYSQADATHADAKALEFIRSALAN